MQKTHEEDRTLKEVIRGLLGSGFSGTQEDICHKVSEQGFKVTQSTVSRTLRRLNANKVRKSGKTYYEVHPIKHEPKFSKSALKHLISELAANDSTIIIKTSPGTAMFVAGFLDHHRPGEILGTIAGDDTIFVAPKDTKKISSALRAIRNFLE